uniref:Uncharacterized protein n=1 Tax=Candidatus Kentrum sp. MB TaxID=2138164 RepID=A0A451BGU3_9GAMM|nr:MAG: hypothetical protein BECKMB1821G_GA0114241_11353 [Candidatus Kentron sp. MB]VFK35637.1 MAG: hypothetical protein BECKMB1821I_GA0114274_11344 [Candidatus Kentron sp. MB]VFK77477.1 MAG: hypothetical protein BECKMB1821H_GA0114242_11453 [Candidatus Kentron sp. MB]
MLLKDEIINLNIINLEDLSPPPEKLYDVTSYNLRLGSQFKLIHGKENNRGGTEGLNDCSEGSGILVLPNFSCALVST